MAWTTANVLAAIHRAAQEHLTLLTPGSIELPFDLLRFSYDGRPAAGFSAEDYASIDGIVRPEIETMREEGDAWPRYLRNATLGYMAFRGQVQVLKTLPTYWDMPYHDIRFALDGFSVESIPGSGSAFTFNRELWPQVERRGEFVADYVCGVAQLLIMLSKYADVQESEGVGTSVPAPKVVEEPSC